MTVGSLFSGIGGMDLGLERAGMRVVWQSEIDPYASQVLARHWPGIPNLGDITRIDWSGVERPDLVCGGFPCQDISFAGKGAGLAGKRSGLWYEFARCVRDLRPRYVLVENVAALLVRGLDAVLGTLATLGYDAEWECLPAQAFGAPHQRERIFIIAYHHSHEHHEQIIESHGIPRHPHWVVQEAISSWDLRFDELESMGIADGPMPYAEARRVLDGIPGGLDRVQRLGNAVVPQVAEWIGRRILESVNA